MALCIQLTALSQLRRGQLVWLMEPRVPGHKGVGEAVWGRAQVLRLVVSPPERQAYLHHDMGI